MKYVFHRASLPGPCNQAITKYYRLGGRLIALRQNGQLRYVHTDHLGSLSLLTDEGAHAVPGSLQRFYPFGKTRTGQPVILPTDQNFTGQQLDANTGLLYYSDGTGYGRYYDPALARFVQPDTLIPNPGDPQQLNRYTYAANNPLKYIDATGHCVTPMGIPIPGCFEMVMRLAQQAEALTVQYGPQVAQFLQVYGDKLPAVVDRVVQFARDAGGRIQRALQGGEPGNAGGLDPNDPFQGLPERVQRGVETLRKLSNHPIERYARGYRAQLARAEYWARRGKLTGVEITGEGGVRFDLELGKQTIVEVKYWTSKFVFEQRGLDKLVAQLGKYQATGKEIVLEMYQTATNPLTQAQWQDILRYLEEHEIYVSSQSQLLPPLQ